LSRLQQENSAILNSVPTAPGRISIDLPNELERITNKALEKDRKLRYQTAADLKTGDADRFFRRCRSLNLVTNFEERRYR
jgi:hypothetical protein